MPTTIAIRRALVVAAALAATLAAGYFLWLRDSSLVAVTEVAVVGAGERPDLREALEGAALTMTTLNVDRDVLVAATGGDPSVRGISTDTDFPRGLTIEVELREPVGVLRAGGRDVVLAADGVVLGSDARLARGLPAITGTDARIEGRRAVGDARAVARALGAAPGPLAELVEEVRIDRELGLVIALAEGIEVRMGDAASAGEKWAAAAAVLADPELDVVSYVDVNAPARPVAGLPPGAY